MSNKYSNKVSLWSDIGSANVSASVSKIRGFPNRFDTTITDLEIKQSSFKPIKIDRLDVMRLSYDSSHYIFAAKSIQNIFENNFTFSKGLASAVSNGEVAPTFNFQGENVLINKKLIFEELNFKVWPTTDLTKLNFSLFARTADIKDGEIDLSFQGKIELNSDFDFDSLIGLVSNIGRLRNISGKLFVKDIKGLDTVIRRDFNSWKIFLKSDSPEKIPSFIQNLNMVVLN
tara:strand:- start:1358 stop:2047 length:690 start_codon:yes stop_codon:yes gene_type:complete